MNLVNHEGLSIIQIADLARKISIEKVNIKFLKELDDDPLRRKPSFLIAQKDLDWKQKSCLRGIET